MSYDIQLVEPTTKETIIFEGLNEIWSIPEEASFTITYNYQPVFARVFGEKGIRILYGMTGTESIPLLRRAIDQLQDDRDDDYWKATEGNVKESLQKLLQFAILRTDGVWQGD